MYVNLYLGCYVLAGKGDKPSRSNIGVATFIGGPCSSKEQFHDNIVPPWKSKMKGDQLICNISTTSNAAANRYQGEYSIS